MTIEDVYTKLVELTELCEQGFIDMRTHLAVLAEAVVRLDKRVSNQDAKLDAFIEDVIEMKRGMKQ